MPRKMIYALIIVTALLAGCIGDGTSPDVEITVLTPGGAELSVEPYTTILFEVSVTGASEDQVRWYVNDVFQSCGSSISFVPGTEGAHRIKAVADNGDHTAQNTWDVQSAIDIPTLMGEISALRDLSFSADVSFEMMTREELQGYLLEDLQEIKDSLDISQKIFESLYAWNGRSLYGDMLLLYSGNIEGLYDFNDKIFYTISDDGKPPIAKKLTIAHELVHVLQDQAYTISGMEDAAADDDQLLAIQSLLEGDAVTIESAYLPSLSLAELNALYDYYMGIGDMNLDPFVAALAYFPYIYGERFVANAIESNGMGYLDTVYANLPISTEQIMHPEKYYLSESPLEIADPHVPLGMASLEENTMGEGMILTIMTQHVTYETAEEACAGWGGDHYGYFESDEDYAFVYDAMWDTVEDAIQWYNAFGQYMLSATGAAIPPGGDEAWIDTDDRTVYLNHSGAATTLIISSDRSIIIDMLG